MHVNDQVLVERAKIGDYQAFEDLVIRYESKVYRLALRFLRNPEDAEDALQESFLQVYRGLKNFEGRSSFSTWLYRLATNVCLMKIRHRSTEPSHMIPLEETLPRHQAGGNSSLDDWTLRPEDALLTKESKEKMLEAMGKLPLDYRAVFILRDVEGLSSVEVGEALGISVAAVKSRLHRARLTLRGMLSGYFGKGEE